MDISTKKVVSFGEYMASTGQGQGGAASAASNLSAPTGQPYRSWTQADKERLRLAVETMVESEEKHD